MVRTEGSSLNLTELKENTIKSSLVDFQVLYFKSPIFVELYIHCCAESTVNRLSRTNFTQIYHLQNSKENI